MTLYCKAVIPLFCYSSIPHPVTLFSEGLYIPTVFREVALQAKKLTAATMVHRYCNLIAKQCILSTLNKKDQMLFNKRLFFNLY